MIVALVCLALMAVMVGVVLRWALMERKLLVRREQKSQAFWLAEAGIERAAAQLDRDQEYSGETWTINADDLPSGEAARVRLKIAQIEGQPRKRSIEVEAEYPAESKLPAKIHKQVVYQLRSGEHP